MAQMKIALLCSDNNTGMRISNAFNKRYSDEIELFTFSSLDMCMCVIQASGADVFIADKQFDVGTASIPKDVAFAYFSDKKNIKVIKGSPAIFIYQKAENLYSDMVDLHEKYQSGEISAVIEAEKMADDTSSIDTFSVNKAMDMSGISENPSKVFSFFSTNGGSGGSTVAAACAMYLAKTDKKVLYLNMEQTGSPAMFFVSRNTDSLGTLIPLIRTKDENLISKLKEIFSVDSSGVFFCNTFTGMEMAEMERKDYEYMLAAMSASEEFDYIVLDCEFIAGDWLDTVMDISSKIVFVSDGSFYSSIKFNNIYSAVVSMEQRNDRPYLNKIMLMYNKFNNASSQRIQNSSVEVLGGAPKFENSVNRMTAQQVSAMKIFEKLL